MRWVKNKVREWYERQINLRYGYLAFIGNIAQLQMSPKEYIDLRSPTKWTGDIRVTCVGARPVLTYTLWKKGAEWRRDMPVIRLIIEDKRLLIAEYTPPENSEKEKDAWEPPAPRLEDWSPTFIEDPRVKVLEPLFHAFAFYQPLKAEWKKERYAEANKKILEQPHADGISEAKPS